MNGAKLSRASVSVWSAFDYAFWRLLAALPSMLMILLATFALLKLAAGDAGDATAGIAQAAEPAADSAVGPAADSAIGSAIGPAADPAADSSADSSADSGSNPAVAAWLGTNYGADQPLLAQLWSHITRLTQFDFGWSTMHERPVREVIADRFWTTMMLSGVALFLAFAVGSAIGTLAARRAGSLFDHAVKGFGFLFYGMPSYFLGLMLIAVFALELQWLPEGGLESPTTAPAGISQAFDVGRHLFLPTTTLMLIYLSHYIRRMHASVLQVARLDHVRTARAKGVTGARLTRDHIVSSALVPIFAPLALQFSMMLSGAVVVESLFALPGLGQLAVESVVQHEPHTLMAVIFVCALAVIGARFWIDVLHAALDRKIKHR